MRAPGAVTSNKVAMPAGNASRVNPTTQWVVAIERKTPLSDADQRVSVVAKPFHQWAAAFIAVMAASPIE